MAKAPIRAVGMHMMPAVGNSVHITSRPIAYVCRQPIEGMVPLRQLKNSLNRHWVYVRPLTSNDANPVDTASARKDTTSTLGDFTQTLEWSPWMGGRPMRWTVADTSDGYSLNFLNNRGGQGR